MKAPFSSNGVRRCLHIAGACVVCGAVVFLLFSRIRELTIRAPAIDVDHLIKEVVRDDLRPTESDNPPHSLALQEFLASPLCRKIDCASLNRPGSKPEQIG